MRDFKPASIKDIARLANVSHSTVSRALQNSKLVNRATADRIQRIARERGYKPSAVARSLVTQKTRTFGVVVTTITDPFAAEVFSGLEEAANQNGYSLFLAESGAEPDREKSVVRALSERRVDGIVILSSRVGALFAPLLSEMQVPIVLINNQHEGEFMHSVMIANREASRMATEHLIGLGHRRIAYIGDRNGHQSDAERLAGYRDALANAGLRFARNLAVEGDGKPDGGMAATRTLLALDKAPTAIFCYNDMTAIGALRCIHEAGLSVPDDISVVGFDDLFLASFTYPPLTTVRQPMRRMGRLAMEHLLNLASGGDPEPIIKIPAELAIRRSTAAPGKDTA